MARSFAIFRGVAVAVQGKRQDYDPSGNRQLLVWLICIIKPQTHCSRGVHTAPLQTCHLLHMILVVAQEQPVVKMQSLGWDFRMPSYE